MTAPSTPHGEERVVLLDDDGNAIGTAPKRTVHHRSTPLHLAFSCYIFDEAGSLLLTRRALHKSTWPGAWTNSACGHPEPGESMTDAVRRRVRGELGMELRDLRLALPAFRYQAEMPNGVRENEICPVFVAVADGPEQPDPDEVAEAVWVPWETLADEVLAGTREVSPWCLEQVAQLRASEVDQGELGTTDVTGLPPAAQ